MSCSDVSDCNNKVVEPAEYKSATDLITFFAGYLTDAAQKYHSSVYPTQTANGSAGTSDNTVVAYVLSIPGHFPG